MGDKRRLLQVLVNLVKNSLKYTSSGSITISISYDRWNQVLSASVRDTGIGL